MVVRRIALAPGDDIVGVVARHPGVDLVIVVHPGRDPVAQAQVEACVAPLAVAAAPAARINAVLVGEGVDPAAVSAAVAYLAAAHAVTGQSLSVGT